MGLRKMLVNSAWAERQGLSRWQLGMITFGILALELALIRWTSSQVRVFAYFNNLVLIGAFLGMGLGVALGRRYPGLVYFMMPVMLLLCLPLAFSESLGLVHLTFPDHTVALWGGGIFNADIGVFVKNIAVFLALFSLIVGIFVCGAAPLGLLFDRLPLLRAYSSDLAGSLLGIVAFAVAAWFGSGPAVWFAVGLLPFVWICRDLITAALAILIIGLAHYSNGDAMFSPYNRIDVHRTDMWLELQVNRDFHQYLHDFSQQRLTSPNLSSDRLEYLNEIKDLYDLPFLVNPSRGAALIVGAGTGNDVQAALRNGYDKVTSVDIDAQIIELGRQIHPENPYGQKNVRAVVDDARSFFGKESSTFYDVVCFGLLDSHAMSSAMSTLRLDNYVYTEEGIRAAWSHVAPNGHLSLAISCAPGRWFFERLYWTITKATGIQPLAMYSPLHASTVTFLVPRNGVILNESEIKRRTQVTPNAPIEDLITPSDDWPFLYVRPAQFPWGYTVVLGFVLMFAALTVPKAFGLSGNMRGFDWPLFLMGAAFLLIETRGVTSMSLLFGSTWVVNAVIFGGIVLMVLLANIAVQRWNLTNPMPWFWPLFCSVLLLYFFPVAWLQAMPFTLRILFAGVITGIPVGLAGIIVPMLLARSDQPAGALGANLLGAVLGGCMEYYSMLGGFRSTALMALVLYLLTFVLVRRTKMKRHAGLGAAKA